MNYPLYTEKNACELCSTSTVQRRVDDREGHAQRHIEAGDPVVKHGDAWIVETATAKGE